MIRVEFIRQDWELLLSIIEDHPSAYLANPMIGEIKNQIYRQDILV